MQKPEALEPLPSLPWKKFQSLTVNPTDAITWRSAMEVIENHKLGSTVGNIEKQINNHANVLKIWNGKIIGDGKERQKAIDRK